MIKNQLYAVLSSMELKSNEIIGTTRLSEKLVFWRDKKMKLIAFLINVVIEVLL